LPGAAGWRALFIDNGISFRPRHEAPLIQALRVEATLANGTRIQADILYPAMGARVHSELATDLGARANRNGCLIGDDKQRTSVPDLYAAGDVTLELHQLAVSLGQAAIAATDIPNSLFPNYC
jgi:thioredoxin reductase (NADPH)